MAVAHVQAVLALTDASSTTATLSLTTTAGNAVAGYVEWFDNAGSITLNSVVGGVAGSMTLVNNPTDDGGAQLRGAHFYGLTGAGGSETFTATFSAAVTFKTMIVHEASGVDTSTPFRASAMTGALNPGSTAANGRVSGNASVVTGDYVAGFIAANGFGPAYTIGTTIAWNQGVNNNNAESEYITAGSTGNIEATFSTGDGTASVTGVLALRQLVAGGRTTTNARSTDLGTEVGMGFRGGPL